MENRLKYQISPRVKYRQNQNNIVCFSLGWLGLTLRLIHGLIKSRRVVENTFEHVCQGTSLLKVINCVPNDIMTYSRSSDDKKYIYKKNPDTNQTNVLAVYIAKLSVFNVYIV